MSVQRGDVYWVSLNPVKGHEQEGFRPVLVLTPDVFNKLTNMPVVLPITTHDNFARRRGFSVALYGCKTQGIVRCDQPRAIDLEARNGKYIETLPTDIVKEVLARVRTLFE